MKKPIIAICALLAVACTFSNCATIIKGSRQSVVILSEPKKATVVIDGLEVGRTPYNNRLARNKKHVVEIKLDGYKSYEATLNRSFNGWIFGNIVFGGIVGLVVDAATGSMYSLSPADISADFSGGTATSKRTGTELSINVVLHADPTWKKVGQLERTGAAE